MGTLVNKKPLYNHFFSKIISNIVEKIFTGGYSRSVIDPARNMFRYNRLCTLVCLDIELYRAYLIHKTSLTHGILTP